MTGQTSCLICDEGKFSEAGQRNCTLCEQGKFIDDKGFIPRAHANSTSCRKCQSGYYSSEDRSRCHACDKGQYLDFALQTCRNCTRGKYAPVPVTGDCIICQAGYHTVDDSGNSVASRAMICTACAAGFFSKALSVNCSMCRSGAYSITASATCIKCRPGSYSSIDRSASCMKCRAGTFESESGSSMCTKCPAGRVSANAGQYSCEVCSRGKFQNLNGQASCILCGGGKYQPAVAGTNCLNCSAGRHASSTGLDKCTECAENSISDGSGTVTCSPCVPPTLTFGGNRKECGACAQGFYRDTSSEECTTGTTTQSCCRPCPRGVECGSATSKRDRFLETLILKPGYFRFTATSTKAYRCERYHRYHEHCTGGNATGRNSCQRNSQGPLCRLCSDGYFHASLNGDCVACQQEVVLLTSVPMIAFCGITIIAIALYRKLQACSAAFKRVRKWTDHNWARVSWALVASRIILLQLQVIVKFSYMQDIFWPQPFRSVIGMLDAVFLDLTSWMPSSECTGINHYSILLFYTLGPFFTAIVIFVITTILVRSKKHSGNHHNESVAPKQRPDSIAWRHAFAIAMDIWLEVMYFVHALICVRIFQTFDCEKFDGGVEGKQQVLRIDYSVDCNSKKHQAYSAYAYFCVVVYVLLVPCAMVFCRRRQAARDSDATLVSFPFKTTFWFFDIWDVTYRLLMTGLLIVLFRHRELRIVACVYIATFQQAIVAYLGPYVNASHNKVTSVGQFIVTLTVTAAYVLETIRSEQRDAIGYMLLFVNLTIIGIVLYQARIERLAAVVDALMIQEPIDRAEFAALWAGKNMQVLGTALLRSSQTCITAIQENLKPNKHWKYLCFLLSLRDTSGDLAVHGTVSAGVRWRPMIATTIDAQLKERREAQNKYFHIVVEGCLEKRGAMNRAWRTRYCVLGHVPGNRGFELYYFATRKKASSFFSGNESANKPKGFIRLSSNIRRIIANEDVGEFQLVELDRTWIFRATSQEEFVLWYDALTSIFSESWKSMLNHAEQKINLEAFQSIVNSIFGLLFPSDVIDSVFWITYSQNNQANSAVIESSIEREALIRGEVESRPSVIGGGAPEICVSDGELGGGTLSSSSIWDRLRSFSHKQHMSARELFQKFDKDENGQVDNGEFISTLLELKVLSADEAASYTAVTGEHDSSDTTIEFHHFVKLLGQKKSQIGSKQLHGRKEKRRNIIFERVKSECKCDKFKLDIESVRYNVCQCGFVKDDHSDLAILRALTEPSNKKSTKQEKIYPSELVTVLEELGSAENQNDETGICESGHSAHLSTSAIGSDPGSLVGNQASGPEAFEYEVLNQLYRENSNAETAIYRGNDPKGPKRPSLEQSGDNSADEDPGGVEVQKISLCDRRSVLRGNQGASIGTELGDGHELESNIIQEDDQQALNPLYGHSSIMTQVHHGSNSERLENHQELIEKGQHMFSTFNPLWSANNTTGEVQKDSGSDPERSQTPSLESTEKKLNPSESIYEKVHLFPTLYTKSQHSLEFHGASSNAADIELEAPEGTRISTWSQQDEYNGEPFIFIEQIESTLESLKGILNLSLEPSIFAVIQTMGIECHNCIIKSQKSNASKGFKGSGSLHQQIRSLDAGKGAKVISQPLPRLQARIMLSHMKANSHFEKMIDEETLPQIMISVVKAELNLFEKCLLTAVPGAVLKGEEVKDGIELLVAPVKRLERIAAKVREYREEKGKGNFPYCQFVTDILRASFICADVQAVLDVFERLASSRLFQVVRLKNKLADGKAPFNLHLNCLFHPRTCKVPIVLEVQIHLRGVYDLQHRQHLAYELRRAKRASECIARIKAELGSLGGGFSTEKAALDTTVAFSALSMFQVF